MGLDPDAPPPPDLIFILSRHTAYCIQPLPPLGASENPSLIVGPYFCNRWPAGPRSGGLATGSWLFAGRGVSLALQNSVRADRQPMAIRWPSVPSWK